jgi:hypothetical protein
MKYLASALAGAGAFTFALWWLLEVELAQALNRAKDTVALVEEAVQRLKDHRLELEAGERDD